MSRDVRPRRRQESWDGLDPTAPQRTPGADADDSTRDAWHISPSRLRHAAPPLPREENLFANHVDQSDEVPERWDGLS